MCAAVAAAVDCGCCCCVCCGSGAGEAQFMCVSGFIDIFSFILSFFLSLVNKNNNHPNIRVIAFRRDIIPSRIIMYNEMYVYISSLDYDLPPMRSRATMSRAHLRISRSSNRSMDLVLR